MSNFQPHSPEYRRRRFWNWFPLGLAYAFLYMGRYNLTVAKTALGELMTKEDFGVIFGIGTVVYALAFLVNGPMIDRIGGRRGMLLAVSGAAIANLAMGGYLYWVLEAGGSSSSLPTVFSVLYALNMYFQSFGAVSIVKVNAHWFHVSERGGFSGIFGTMISSGLFFAFTVNKWILDLTESIADKPMSHAVFFAPFVLLVAIGAVEAFVLRDRPSDAGYRDFDTGDAAGNDGDAPIPTLVLFKRLLTNPILLTVAAIEFCTGVVRNGVMHWFPIYASEVWALPKDHALVEGSWEHLGVLGACFAVAAISFVLASRWPAKRAVLVILGGAAFLAPFLQAGWGGILMVAGVIGANAAGWVSDVFFGSRRGPSVTMLYVALAVCTLVMAFVLAPAGNQVDSADGDTGLEPGDLVLAIGEDTEVHGWAEVSRAIRCWPAQECEHSAWDPEACMCSSSAEARELPPRPAGIPATIERDGQRMDLLLRDPKPHQRAGDQRRLVARPVLPLSPFWLGAIVFFISLAVIGSHGLLSGTATMDFGGRRGAATAVGMIDGFVYLGTAVQSFALGRITTLDWAYWPWFLLPFTIIGIALCARIWHAHPDAVRKGAKK